MKITVVSPHRDDAAFSLGLAVGTWLEAGHRVEVMNCFTRSEYAPFGDLQSVHANDRRSFVTALRRREDLCWIRSYRHPIGLIDLNLRDAPLRLQCGPDEVCDLAVNPADPALEKVKSMLRRIAPQMMVLPLGVGDHVDHLTARTAAQDAWPEAMPLAFYEDLPYSARTQAASCIEARAESLALSLEASFASGSTGVAAAIEKKRRLALCYDSQIESEVTDQIAQFCARYDGRERLWVNRAWREAAIGTTD